MRRRLFIKSLAVLGLGMIPGCGGGGGSSLGTLAPGPSDAILEVQLDDGAVRLLRSILP